MECFNSILPQNGAAFHGFLTGSTQKIPKNFEKSLFFLLLFLLSSCIILTWHILASYKDRTPYVHEEVNGNEQV